MQPATLDAQDVSDFVAVVFGAGDFHTRTENRPAPPRLMAGDRLALGPLTATVTAVLDHPRFVSMHFDGSVETIWAGIARHGRPIQYAHMLTPLALWDVWTPSQPPRGVRSPVSGFALNGEPSPPFTNIGSGLPPLRTLPEFHPQETMSSTTLRSMNRTRFRNGGGNHLGFETGGWTNRRNRHHRRSPLEHAAAENGFVQAVRGLANQASDRLLDSIVDAILPGFARPRHESLRTARAFMDATTSTRREWLEAHRYRSTNSAIRFCREGRLPLRYCPHVGGFKLLVFLRSVDSPTISNAIEICDRATVATDTSAGPFGACSPSLV